MRRRKTRIVNTAVSAFISLTNSYLPIKMCYLRQVWWSSAGLCWEGVAELQELSFCKSILCAARRSAATESLFKVSQWRRPPLLSDLVDPDSDLDVEHVRKHEGKGLSVQRILFFYYYSFSLSFHFHPVGRRLSFCLGTHSLHTVGKSLNKNKKNLFYNR